MPITGISRADIHRYVSRLDEARVVKPGTIETDLAASMTNGATIWLLGVLDVDVRAAINDSGMAMTQHTDGNVDLKMLNGMKFLKAVRHGLIGWENFVNEAGGHFVFKPSTLVFSGKSMSIVSDESLACIPQTIINELGQQIIDDNTVTEALKKRLRNLLSPFSNSQRSNAESVAPDTDSNAVALALQASLTGVT